MRPRTGTSSFPSKVPLTPLWNHLGLWACPGGKVAESAPPCATLLSLGPGHPSQRLPAEASLPSASIQAPGAACSLPDSNLKLLIGS